MDNEPVAPLDEIKLRSLTVKRWLRTDEVALYLGTTRASIKKLVLRQRLEPRKLYGRLYFDRNVIDGLIESSPRSASQAQPRRDKCR